MNCRLLFVYGTLRKHFERNRFLNAVGARFLSRGTVRGRLYDLGGYPGAVSSKNPADIVKGEVYRLPDPRRALKTLDEVEGANPSSPDSGLYRRAIVAVRLEKPTHVEAWMYWLNRWHGARKRIVSGDYARVSE